MITKSFLESLEYSEFKLYLEDNLLNKPIDLNTENKTSEQIAREVAAYEIAAKMVIKTIKRFERQVMMQVKEKQKFV